MQHLVQPAVHPVLDSILRRRSTVKLGDACPPREAIRTLLDAAVTAPNHHLNQPWRFFVLAGVARERYGEVLADRLARTLPDPTTPAARARLEAERRKPLRAPVLIVAASVATPHPKAVRLEDAAATAAAVQNMFLAAPALGLGAFWRSGEAAVDPSVKAYFGLAPEDDIVGFLYVGYPETEREPLPRAPAEERTRWLGWED